MAKVSIGKTVDYKTLETALLKAAKDIGLKAYVKDKFNKSYKLGSVKEVQEYNSTNLFLKGKLFNVMQVSIYGKKPTDYFFVEEKGFASEKRVQEYLSAVSQYL